MTDEAIEVFAHAAPRIRRVAVDRPWAWLAAGWRDVTAAPRMSLAYGALIVVITYLLLFLLLQAGMFWLVLPLTAGFFFTAPLLAVGPTRQAGGLPQGSRSVSHAPLPPTGETAPSSPSWV